MLKELVLVFPGSAVTGSGKPALVEALGEEAALVVQRELLAHIRAVAGKLAESGRDVVFVLEHRDETSRRELHLDGFSVLVQEGGGIAERVRRVTSAVFSAGATRVVIVLRESPVLSAPDVDAAFAALEDASVAVASSAGDECVLLGLSVDHEGIFDRVSVTLTTSHVKQSSSAAGRRLRELPPLWTVETLADYERALELGLLHAPVVPKGQG